MKRKLTAMLAASLCATLLLTSCSTKAVQTQTQPAPATDTNATAQTDTQSEAKPETPAKSALTPITFTMYHADMSEDDQFNNPIAKKITELTGVTLKFDYPVGGSTERVPLMISSADYPDIIYAKGDTTKLYDAGALVQLDDMIEQRGENIKKLYGSLITRLRMNESDPHYYGLGAYGVGSQIWNVSSTMPIQNAVLKEFGYPKIKTTKDVEDLLVKYIEKYPEIDGKKTIGLSLNCDDWHWYIDLSNPPGFLAGYPDNGQWIIDNNTFEAQYKFLNDKLKENYRWFNHLNDIGILDPETFTQKSDDWLAKIANGQVLSLVAADWEYGEANTTLISDGKFERTYAHLPITMDESTTPINSYDAGWSGSWGISITTKCKDVDRAFDFLNWYCSDEAQVLVNWGIEGEHYTVENGKRIIIPEIQAQKNTDPDFVRKTGVGKYVYPFPQYGDGVLDATGNTYTTASPENIKENYNDAVKETLKAYGAEMWKDLYPPTETFPLSPFGAAWQISIPTDSDVTVIQKQADDLSQMTLPQIVLCNPSEFDQKWDDYIKALKGLGIDKANEEFTGLVKAKVEFWKN